ncbi:RNA methyltransferase, partial [Microbacterium sp. zg.Y909]|nr:RNA methyltransferase [Microbacterium sp. zg.Y909]
MTDLADAEPEAEPTLPYGVGPWPGGPEAWPDDPRYDPELLAHGD